MSIMKIMISGNLNLKYNHDIGKKKTEGDITLIITGVGRYYRKYRLKAK
ncbi:MAG: hypothetical protein ACTSR8_19950 [Promethearchaeota archaeon]